VAAIEVSEESLRLIVGDEVLGQAACSPTSPNVIERIPSPVHVDTVASD